MMLAAPQPSLGSHWFARPESHRLFASIAYPMGKLKSSVSAWFVFTGTLVLIAQCAASMAIMLGAAAPTPDLAVALAPMPAVPFIVTGGFFANSERLDGFWIWLKKLSFFSYCFEIVAVNEYKDQTFADAPPPMDDGNWVLENLGLKPENAVPNAIVMLCFIVVYRALGAMILMYRVRRTEGGGDVLPPEESVSLDDVKTKTGGAVV